MEELLQDAINILTNEIHIWDLTETELENLRMANKGNLTAFCNLLTSTNLQYNSKFTFFYKKLNTFKENKTGEKK